MKETENNIYTNLGFTGTRRGMTSAQKKSVREFLQCHGALTFHHGDCVGADAQAGYMAHMEGIRIIVHPPLDESHRARVPNAYELRAPKTHFARNRDIVDECEALLAVPCETKHQPRGGTWYTVDYAQKCGKPVWIFWPDGTVTQPEAKC